MTAHLGTGKRIRQVSDPEIVREIAVREIVGDLVEGLVGQLEVVVAHATNRTGLDVRSGVWLHRLAITSGQLSAKERPRHERGTVATADECKVAIGQLAARFSRGDQAKRNEGMDRTVSAMITDLGLLFHGHMHDGVLDDITLDEAPPAQIRLTMSSDDLLALASGELSLGSAWLGGRLKVHASFPDMLRLRSMV